MLCCMAGSIPTALPKLLRGGFPICQDRGLHGAKGAYKLPDRNVRLIRMT